MNILVWNINVNAEMDDVIAESIKEHNVDILVIVEPHPWPNNLLLKINEAENNYYYNYSRECTHVNIFSRFNQPQLSLIKDYPRTTGWNYKSVMNDSFNIIVTHFCDQFFNEDEDQQVEINKLIKEIEEIEDVSGCLKTILVGDLNIDPYNNLCLHSNYLNALMCRKTVKRLKTRNGRKLFYNASWNLLGDRFHTPGTFYRSTKGGKRWSVLDQVLLRPELIDQFQVNSIKTLVKINDKQLVSKNDIPITKIYSDHLPVFFKLNL